MPRAPKTFEPPLIHGELRTWKRWYGLAVWRGPRGLRKLQLDRQPLCEDCLAEGKTTPATEVDHVIAHRGRWEVFTDRDNLRSNCRFHHNQKTGRGE